jgi:hypothetical protein
MNFWHEVPVGERSSRRVALAAILLLLASATIAGAEIIRVGTAAACDEDTIALALLRAALNGEPADEIRIPRNIVYTNVALHLTDWDPATAGSLVLAGGYDSCADATASGDTSLHGNGGAPVLEVDTASRPISEVTIRNLDLQGGSIGLLAQGGADVIVDQSRIRLNDGGIEVESGADVEISGTSQIRENSGATFGAGIFCIDTGSVVTVHGAVSFNTATNAGGGIYANSGCLVRLRSGVFIEGNQASLGGGLYIAGTARAENVGTGSASVSIYSNVATSEGGGIYMAGAGPQTLLGNVRIVSNDAGTRGGGVALVGGARLQLERFNFEACPHVYECMKIDENSLLTGGEGSAVYADGSSEFRMAQGFIGANHDAGTGGLVIFANGASTLVHLEGVQLVDNQTFALFHAENGAEVRAAFVTAVSNYYNPGGGPGVASYGATATGAGQVHLFSSILTDHQDFLTATGGQVHGDCLILETVTGLTSHAESMVGVNPGLLYDAGEGKYRLSAGSLAVDSCDTFAYTPLDSDFDLDTRGFDLASKPNHLGTFDRGADELVPLFADGFVSGNTGAWSATVP